jgi:endonuclease/exonuclease/phosphatase family metal-dependent hydrolase
MLPVSLKNVGQAKRVIYIAEQLNTSNYDVIVFQEAFDRKARYNLSKQIRKQFPYQEGPANAKPSFLRMNSGVWIVSKHPMKFVDEIIYKKACGVDKVARKGALLVDISKNNRTYQIAGTHMQAGNSVKKNNVRISQLLQLKEELLEKNEIDGVPQIICGDFNTPKSDCKHYELITDSLKVTDGPFESSLQYTYDTHKNELATGSNYQEVLDYIFVKENKRKLQFSRRKVVAFNAKWHKSRKSLSDHFAVELVLVTQ